MGVVFVLLQGKVWMFCPSTAAGFVRICLNFFIPVVGSFGLFWERVWPKSLTDPFSFLLFFFFFCCRCHILGTFLTVEFRTCIRGLLSVLISPNPFCNCAILFASWGSGCEIKWWVGGGGGGGLNIEITGESQHASSQYCRFRTEAFFPGIHWFPTETLTLLDKDSIEEDT